MDDTDPLVTVMKVEKAPQETYADIGGLDNQIQEIKVFSCTHLQLTSSVTVVLGVEKGSSRTGCCCCSGVLYLSVVYFFIRFH